MAMVSKLMLAQGHASGSSCIAVGAVLLSSVVRGGMVQYASLAVLDSPHSRLA